MRFAQVFEQQREAPISNFFFVQFCVHFV